MSKQHPPSVVYNIRHSRTVPIPQRQPVASRAQVTKGRPTGESPHTWCTGPDPRRHRHYRKWHSARAQARHHSIEWALTFEDWLEIWGDALDAVGRSNQNLCLARTDQDQGWVQGNVSVTTRREHCRRLMLAKWARS